MECICLVTLSFSVDFAYLSLPWEYGILFKIINENQSLLKAHNINYVTSEKCCIKNFLGAKIH